MRPDPEVKRSNYHGSPDSGSHLPEPRRLSRLLPRDPQRRPSFSQRIHVPETRHNKELPYTTAPSIHTAPAVTTSSRRQSWANAPSLALGSQPRQLVQRQPAAAHPPSSEPPPLSKRQDASRNRLAATHTLSHCILQSMCLASFDSLHSFLPHDNLHLHVFAQAGTKLRHHSSVAC